MIHDHDASQDSNQGCANPGQSGRHQPPAITTHPNTSHHSLNTGLARSCQEATGMLVLLPASLLARYPCSSGNCNPQILCRQLQTHYTPPTFSQLGLLHTPGFTCVHAPSSTATFLTPGLLVLTVLPCCPQLHQVLSCKHQAQAQAGQTQSQPLAAAA
jgi:hypothetical protein